MGENSAIEWTDHTFNPWIGCAKVAAGCTHCYAEAFAKRYNKAAWGPHGTRVKTSDAYWRKPLKWNREAEAAGERRRVFCASLADVFEDWQGDIVDSRGQVLMTDKPTVLTGLRPIEMDDLRRDLFALVDATPHLDWLLLTKRPENIRRMWAAGPPADFCPFCDSSPCQQLDECSSYAAMVYRQNHPANYRHNVWLLTSIATQEDADRNVPELLKCRDLVPVLGLSCEPLVGPVDLRFDDCWLREDCYTLGERLDWVIVGGESGPGARPMHPDWARSLRDQCQGAGVPFFMKQMDKKMPIPKDLFVRQYPNVEAIA